MADCHRQQPYQQPYQPQQGYAAVTIPTSDMPNTTAYSSAQTPYAVMSYSPPIAHGVDVPPAQTTTGTCTVGRWGTGFCSCCDSCIPNCCMTWCCQCISVAQIIARLGMYPYSTASMIMIGMWVAQYACQGAFYNSLLDFSWGCAPTHHTSTTTSNYTYDWHDGTYTSDYVDDCSFTWSWSVINIYSVLYTLLQIASLLIVFYLRMRVRERFQIPGNPIVDFLAACCCPCCTVAQIATHVQSYKPGKCDFDGPDVLPSYEQ